MKKEQKQVLKELEKRYGMLPTAMAQQNLILTYGTEKLGDSSSVAQIKSEYRRAYEGKNPIIPVRTFEAAIDAAYELIEAAGGNNVALLQLLTPPDLIQPSCPVCNGRIEYDDSDTLDVRHIHAGSRITRHWSCIDCGAHGAEESTVCLDTYRDVYDESGQEVTDL